MSDTSAPDSANNPIDDLDIDMQVHQLLGMHRQHQELARLALGLAVQMYSYRSDATPVGAARIAMGKDPDS